MSPDREDPTTGGARSPALLTDLYELTMLQAYWTSGMSDEAVFSLFVRRLPPSRNLLVACGLDDALRYLEELRFTEGELAYLRELGTFSDDFLEWLAKLRFEGDVYAVPEGTPVFAEEPLLEVVAPLPQAQMVESRLMNIVHLQTMAASKGYRVVEAARGRPVVDFGMRRMHGADAALKAARAFYIAGVEATSNVLAGKRYGIPVAGTMAHSFVQAHGSEGEAFQDFAELYPETTLLVDTYDTLEGVREVVRLRERMGERFSVRAVRLDSGDLAAQAREARRILDDGGLTEVRIFASGSLDEHELARLIAEGAPIDGFGVGTRMGVSEDAPSLDMAYKLTSYAGRGRIKLSPDKRIIPGRKQIFRVEEEGQAVRDVMALAGEELAGRPLLRKVMDAGRRLPGAAPSLSEIREVARRELELLPDAIRSIERCPKPYSVELSPTLAAYAEEVAGAET